MDTFSAPLGRGNDKLVAGSVNRSRTVMVTWQRPSALTLMTELTSVALVWAETAVVSMQMHKIRKTKRIICRLMAISSLLKISYTI